MNRPKNALFGFADADTYTDPGKPFDGEPTRVTLSNARQQSGFKPGESPPAVVANGVIGQHADFLRYLDQIEAKNWVRRCIFGVRTVLSLYGQGGGSSGGNSPKFTSEPVQPFMGIDADDRTADPATEAGAAVSFVAAVSGVFRTSTGALRIGGNRPAALSTYHSTLLSSGNGGHTWERSEIPIGDGVVLAAWNDDDEAAVVAFDSGGDPAYVGGTYNGTSWSSETSIGSNYFPRSLAWVERESIWCATGRNGSARSIITLAYNAGATDVAALTIAAGSSRNVLFQAHSDGASVVVDDQGRVFTTDDFANAWTDRGIPAGGAVIFLHYWSAFAIFVMATAAGAIWTSTDGVSWSNVVNISGGGLSGAAASKGGCMMIEAKPGAVWVLKTSIDGGISWQTSSLSPIQGPRVQTEEPIMPASATLTDLGGQFCMSVPSYDGVLGVDFPEGAVTSLAFALRT